MIRNRYRRIVIFFARALLSVFFWQIFLPRIGLRQLSRRNRSKRLRKAAKGYRDLATNMGGVLIKVGQFISTRVDVMPPEFTSELEGLQDEVPSEDFEDIRRVAEDEFGMELEKKFLEFNPVPLAAASLGQVHLARIEDSDLTFKTSYTLTANQYNVVVKIQRPHIEEIIATDLAALRTVARWLHRYKPIRKRANIPQLLDEFTTILYEEIDYLAEGRNAETFKQYFSEYKGVRVPHVVWTHTTTKALTLENVLAIKITDYQAITQAGVDRSEVASRLLDTYLKQIFEDGFFHADPHPGNLFVQPLEVSSDEEEPNLWMLTFIDFGMVGKVAENLKHGLRELLIAIGTQDSSRIVNAYQNMGILLPGADLKAIEKASAKVFERYWGKNMSELSAINYEEMKEFADEFRDLIFDLPFQVPQNMIYLARAVGILSGMCTGLDPEFNLWDHLSPYARKLISEEAGSGIKEIWAVAEKQLRALSLLPGKMDLVLGKMEAGEITFRSPELTKQNKQIEHAIKRLTWVIFSSTFLLIGAIFFVSQYITLSISFVSIAIIVLFLSVIYSRPKIS